MLGKSNIRKYNLEFRTCGEHLLESEAHTTGEIVEYAKENTNCWAIAYWRKTNDGYNLQFVGSRPFSENIDVDVFWSLVKIGQQILDDSEE